MIEKCIQCTDQKQLAKVCNELFSPSSLFELMTDKYANFVIQKTLEVAEGDLQSQLVTKVNEQSASIRTFPYGRHVLNCLEKLKRNKASS